MLLALVVILLGCREELTYIDNDQNKASYNLTRDNLFTKVLFKQDYNNKPFIKSNINLVNQFLKQNISSTASSKSNSEIYGHEVYTDVFEEVSFQDSKYYSFYITGDSSKEYEQKLLLKTINNVVVSKYILKYKRISNFKIDETSYELTKLVNNDTAGNSGDENGLIKLETSTITVGCSTYTTTTFDCGEGGHHSNGQFCTVLGINMPENVVTIDTNPNCNTTGGGSTGGNTGGGNPTGNGSGGSTNNPFPGDNTPEMIFVYSQTPYYEIDYIPHTQHVFNYLNLSNDEIIQLNSNNMLRYNIFRYLEDLGLYPFNYFGNDYSEAEILVKQALKYFRENAGKNWLDFYNQFINTPCEKTKKMLQDPKFKGKFDELTKPEVFTQSQERAYVMKHPPIGTTGVVPAFISIDMPPCSTGDEGAVWPSSFDGITIIMHTHNNEDCNGNIPVKAPSPVDIRTLINKLLSQGNTYTGSYLGAASFTMTSNGTYMLMYEGTAYPGSISRTQLDILYMEYKKAFKNLYEDNTNPTKEEIEKVFTKFLKEKINKPGLNVYRVTPTTSIKLEYDPTQPNSVKQTPCPL